MNAKVNVKIMEKFLPGYIPQNNNLKLIQIQELDKRLVVEVSHSMVTRESVSESNLHIKL